MDHHATATGSLEPNTHLIDIATRNVIRLAPGDGMGDAARIMAEKSISSVVVTDEKLLPVGIVTEHDMLLAMQSGRSPGTALREVMSSPVIVVPASMSCLEGYQRCLHEGVRHLVIVDDEGHVLGVVSETDFHRYVSLAILAGRRPVASVMNQSVFTLPPQASLQDALNLMQSHRDTCVVVVVAGRPVGVITERDIVRLFAGNPGQTGTPVSEIMTSPVLSITLDDTVQVAAERMLAARVRHLVVVEPTGQLAGLLSQYDLTHAMAGKLIDDRIISEGVFLHTLIRTIPDMIWLKDVDGVYLACNPRFERFFGAKEKDIAGKTDYDFMSREIAELFRDYDRKAMEKGGPSTNEEWVTYADDGHRELLETVKTPMYDATGRLIGVLGIARDITAHRQMENSLEQSERKLHDIYDSVGDCIEIISADGRILDMNRIGYERMGYAREEMIGRKLSEFAPPEFAGRVAERMAQIKRDGYATFESGRLRKDGSVMPLEVRSRLIQIDGEDVFLGISRDITERKAAEQVLQKLNEDLSATLRAIPDLLFELDQDGRYHAVWAHDPELLAAQQELLLGRTVFEMLPQEAAAAVMGALREAGEKGYSQGQIIHLELPQGSRWFELSAAAKPVAEGALRRFMMLSRDVTDRMKTEEELHDSHAKLNGLFSLSNMGIALTDMQGRYIEFNDAFREICGYTREELNQLDYWELTPKEYAAKEAEQLESLNTRGYYGPYEKEYIQKDGSRIPLRLNGVLIHDKNGTPFIWSIVEDITRSKQAEKELREKEERLALATLHNGVGIWDWNLVTQEMVWDDSMYVLYHIRREDFIGTEEAWRAALHPDDLERGDREVQDAISGVKPFDTEFRVVWPEGEIRHIKAVAKVFRDDQGRPLRMLGTNVDITDRKRVESALAESERRFRTLIENSPFCIHEIDLDGRLQSMNRAGLDMLGLDEEGKVCGVPYLSAVSEQDGGRIEALLQDAINGTASHFEFASSGETPLYFKSCFIPIRDTDGKVMKLMGITEDISERKAAEQLLLKNDAQLREQKEFLDAVFENALDAVVLMDDKGVCTRWNHQAEAVFGWKREDAIGRPMHELIVPERYRAAHASGLKHYLDTGEGPVLNRRFEITALHRDGGEFPVEISITPIRTPEGYEFSSFIRDITERQRLERQVRESEELFRAVFTQAPSAVELIDPDTLRFIEANPAACAMLGYTREEYLQLRLTDTQAEILDEAALRASIRHIEEQGGATFENRHRCKSGDILEVEISARILSLSGRRLLVGVWRDITERKRAEEAIRESENKYRSLFEAAGDGIFLQNGGGFIDCNEKGAAMYGLTREEVIGRSPVSLAPERQPDGRLSAQVAGEKIAAAMGGQPCQFEWQALRADGSTLNVEINVSRIEYKGEACLQAVVRDISERKRAENALREREEIFSSIVNQAADSILLVDAETLRFVEFNSMAHESLGYTREEFGQMTLPEVQAQYNEEQVRGILHDAIASGRSILIETQHRRKDGSIRETQISSRAITIHGRNYFSSIWSDITNRKRAEESLRVTASVFDTSQEAIVITDADNLIIDVNPAFTHITGYSREEVQGRNPKFLSSGRKDKAFYDAMWKSLEQYKSWRGEIWNRRKSGELYAELLSISVISDDNGKVLRYVGVFSDISHLKKHEAELSRAAHYDALTGIPNRVLLADRMKQAIAQTAREQEMMAVCYLDLDGFKPVNDTLGHEAGDQVLIEIAKRIGNTIRGGDTVARLGGDEFVVLLLGLERGDECVTTLERLLAAVSQPIDVKNTQVKLGTSIGVSIYPLDDEDPDILLRHADQAMYVAKHSGKNRFYIYDASLDQRTRNHHEFRQSIHYGLELGQFELYYQPKVNLVTKELAGVEALIRWQHPERGMLLPMEFLRSTENTELEIEIGDWVIARALAQMDSWHKAGRDIKVSINISAYHLESPRFVEKLHQNLAQYPELPSGMLQIEVLETAALNDLVIVCKIIDECRRLGVSFALDDFGTGYSSLSYLSSLPVDVLKIDQSFVRDMLEDRGDMAIVQGIIALARAFERSTVGEGIETEQHYQALRDMGCDLGQGYGIARPLPADELIKWKAA